MTESEWLGEDSVPLLEFVESHPSARKARLLACGWVRRRWDELEGMEDCRAAVVVVERYADGLANIKELRRASDAAYLDHCRRFGAEFGFAGIDACVAAHDDPWEFVKTLRGHAIPYCRDVKSYSDPKDQGALEKYVHVWHSVAASLIRDIYGNPCIPAGFDTEWRSPEVVMLARAIYEEWAFKRMPVLGDALEEAGCDNVDILAHCSSEADHTRGCWVVDLILGKS